MIHLAGATQIARSSYGYDLWGNRSTQTESLAGATPATLAKSYSYDALDRLKAVANGTAAQTEGYAFDVFGNRLIRSIGSPITQSWASTYDAAHQLTQIQLTSGGTAVTALLRYDDNGNLRKLCEAGSGSGSVSGSATDCTASGSQSTSTTWDGLDRLVGLARAAAAVLDEVSLI